MSHTLSGIHLTPRLSHTHTRRCNDRWVCKGIHREYSESETVGLRQQRKTENDLRDTHAHTKTYITHPTHACTYTHTHTPKRDKLPSLHELWCSEGPVIYWAAAATTAWLLSLAYNTGQNTHIHTPATLQLHVQVYYMRCPKGQDLSVELIVVG